MGNEILKKLLATTACESIVQELPRKKTDWSSPIDPDRKGIASLVRERGAHLGCLIAEDLQQIVCLDETGEQVSWNAIGLFALDEILIEHRNPTVVVSETISAQFAPSLSRRGVSLQRSSDSPSDIVLKMIETDAGLGIGRERIWFDDGGIACDGLMLLGSLLQSMSRTDIDLSSLSHRVLKSGHPIRA
jgi:phosphomannomutase